MPWARARLLPGSVPEAMAMRAELVIQQIVTLQPADYVRQVRSVGRDSLDPGLRFRMAELYEAIRPLRRSHWLTGRERGLLRLVEPVFEAEWKLAVQGGEPSASAIGQPYDPLTRRGKRYLAYANLRVLNDALGTNGMRSNLAVDQRCWWSIGYLAQSWQRYERHTLIGTQEWNIDALPDRQMLSERADRLGELVKIACGQGFQLVPIHTTPPTCWYNYVDDRAATLEFLTALPATTQHDEVAFLRSIHLVEAGAWGALLHVIAAVEWLKRGQLEHGTWCLQRAGVIAQVRRKALLALRRTMPVAHFMAFRDATGDASAVQSLPNQLLHIHLLGVHPAKVEALSEVPENEYLLLYANNRFIPLRKILSDIRGGTMQADALLAAAQNLDHEIFGWNKLHFGMANRYLKTVQGTGKTAGAAYLGSFYRDRLFDEHGRLTAEFDAPQITELAPWIRARPVLSAVN
jgi:tryptophan 2,3-dioxygenase